MGNVWGIIVIFKNHNLLKQDNIFTKVSFPKRDKYWARGIRSAQTKKSGFRRTLQCASASSHDGYGFHDFFHAEEVAVVRLDVDGVYVGLRAFVNFVLQALDVCVRHEFDFVEL